MHNEHVERVIEGGRCVCACLCIFSVRVLDLLGMIISQVIAFLWWYQISYTFLAQPQELSKVREMYGCLVKATAVTSTPRVKVLGLT